MILLQKLMKCLRWCKNDCLSIYLARFLSCISLDTSYLHVEGVKVDGDAVPNVRSALLTCFSELSLSIVQAWSQAWSDGICVACPPPSNFECRIEYRGRDHVQDNSEWYSFAIPWERVGFHSTCVQYRSPVHVPSGRLRVKHSHSCSVSANPFTHETSLLCKVRCLDNLILQLSRKRLLRMYKILRP